MKKSAFMRRFAVLLLVSGLASATDPRLDMVTTLKASGPHRSLGDRAKVFATNLRYFDSKTGTWHATFVDPANDSIMRFTGVVEAPDRIVFRSQPIDGKELRWSCNDIRRDSFLWREEASRDGGQTWRLDAELHMTRRDATHHAK